MQQTRVGEWEKRARQNAKGGKTKRRLLYTLYVSSDSNSIRNNRVLTVVLLVPRNTGDGWKLQESRIVILRLFVKRWLSRKRERLASFDFFHSNGIIGVREYIWDPTLRLRSGRLNAGKRGIRFVFTAAYSLLWYAAFRITMNSYTGEQGLVTRQTEVVLWVLLA